METSERWQALPSGDKAELEGLFEMLDSRVEGNPYSSDGSFAKTVSLLPPGAPGHGSNGVARH